MRQTLISALDRRAERAEPLRLWLRDDDATEPGAALDRLLALTGRAGVPLTLAVIPARSGIPLAARLRDSPGASVAVHGWAHKNHAWPFEKPQELGAHRPASRVLEELARGLGHLQRLHGAQFMPVMVPPWNRIAPQVVAGLPTLGFRGLSVFGPEKPAPLPVVNTHVDLIDWRGSRGGRAEADLLAALLNVMKRDGPVGLMTHHLVHDARAWAFLELLFDLTAGHPGCRWCALPELLALP